MAGGGEEPGVVEVVASPESDGPFTEEMINQVISMLQSEGQITPETHTVIVHTGNGPTLRVQIQQVESSELEQDNIEELGTEPGVADQDQLVYVGQAEDEYHQQQQQMVQQQMIEQQQQQQQQMVHHGHHHQQQTVTSDGTQHLLQNGGQFLSMEEAGQSMPDVNHMEYSTANTEVGIPAALMSNVAEQVLQAATLMDGGSYTTAVSGNTGVMTEVATAANAGGGLVSQAAPVQINGGLGMHTESLHNGVVLSYGAAPVQQQQGSHTYMAPNGLLDTNTRINGHTLSSIRSSSAFTGNKPSTSQYTDHNDRNTSSYSHQASTSINRSSGLLNRQQQEQAVKSSSSHTFVDGIVKIKIDTGFNNIVNNDPSPPNVIRISTTTGELKTRASKYIRCPNCIMHFASEPALLQHIRHGCSGSRKRTSYECTYCSSKFPSKGRTVEHLKVCALRTQVKSGGRGRSIMQGSATGRVVSRKPTTQMVEVEINSDEEEETAYRQEKNIVYDDDDDVDVDLAADNEDYESHLTKVPQKHLGPVLTEGKFKCRDCDRTFNKDAQYKRHIGACTNAPLNASRIDDSEIVPAHEKKVVVPERKRGRPKKIHTNPAPVTPAYKYKSSVADRVKAGSKATYSSQYDMKDDLSDLDWELQPSPKKDKATETVSNSKQTNHIMEILKENLSDGNLVDGSKDLSESFLQCLDGTLTGAESKNLSPNKVCVCGLCIRHMNSNEELAEHISTVHAKDVVNMHAILTNNTDLTTHKCSLCALHFVSVEGVKEHLVAGHLDQLQESGKALRINSLDLPCPWCPHKSLSKELFQQHLASQHTRRFPETALAPALKPEELAARSLKASHRAVAGKGGQDMLAGRVCLSCGTSFSKWNKLEQHAITCAEQKTEGQHPCYFLECKSQAYDSLAELVAHIEEEHGSDTGCERRLFPNSQLFGSWLQQEQQRTGHRYTRATSRVRAGCCHLTYLCQSYNQGDKGKGAKPCYARLHVRTRWCHSKFDYCGRTEVTHYKEHQHSPSCEDNFAAIVEASKTLQVRFKSSDRVRVDEAATPSPEPAVSSARKTEAKGKVQSPGERSLTNKEGGDEEETDEINAAAVRKITGSVTPVVPGKFVNKKLPSADRPARTPVPKQQFSPDSSPKPANKLTKPKMVNSVSSGHKRVREEYESDEDFYPDTKRKMLAKGGNNSLKGRGGGLMPGATGNNKSINNNLRKGISNNNNNTSGVKRTKAVAPYPTPRKKPRPPSPPATEETTYVLPANLSEWCKLFDMVHGQITAGSLKKTDVPEARSLLKHQTDITELPLEEQVRVFHRLCNLANIQVD